MSVTEPGAAGGLDLITWSEFGFNWIIGLEFDLKLEGTFKEPVSVTAPYTGKQWILSFDLSKPEPATMSNMID